MKKGTIVLIVILIIAGLFVMQGFGKYNQIVVQDEGIEAQWGNVEAAYQRRSDLIPNLVNTVKGYADFEKETLTGVIEARSKATSIQLKADDLTPENMAKFEAAQEQLSGALSRLLVSVERYPDLKANSQFMNLQQELTNTENKIGFERQKFNEKIKAYNSSVRTFPGNIVASIGGFEKRDGYFKSTAGSDVAPEVSF